MAHPTLPAIAERIRTAPDRDALSVALAEAEETLVAVLSLDFPAPAAALAAQAFDDVDKLVDYAPIARTVAARRLAVLLDAVAELTR